MKRETTQLPFIAALLCASLDYAPAFAASEAEVQSQFAAAERAAGDDLKTILRLCRPAPVERPSVSDATLAQWIATPGPGRVQVFDNLVFLGSGWVSAWALQATDGVVLIDALNTAEEVDQLIVGGMKQLGMDPAQIKAVVVTHSHGDQYDGAQRINEVAAVSEPRIVMTDLDWKMTGTALEFASPLWPAPPRYDAQRDVSAKDGDVFRHGGTDVRLPQTPGHTMGTISPILEVKLGCVTHRAMIWGGTGFNFGRDLDRMDAHIRSTERMKDLVRQLSVDVLLSNHQSYDGTMDKVAALRGSRPADAPHPYIVGKETVIRALTAAGECARANQVRFEMTPVTLAFGRMPVQSLARR